MVFTLLVLAGNIGKERHILRHVLVQLVEFASLELYQRCHVDNKNPKAEETIEALIHGKWCWWRSGEKGFPVLVYNTFLAVRGGLLVIDDLTEGSGWEDVATRGSWAVNLACWLIQDEMGRFAEADEIRALAPRILEMKLQISFSHSHGLSQGNKLNSTQETDIEVISHELRKELRESQEFEKAVQSGQTFASLLNEQKKDMIRFVEKNFGCRRHITPFASDCYGIHVKSIRDIATLWNEKGTLLGLRHETEDSLNKILPPSGNLAKFGLVVVIYANNRPVYLQQVKIRFCELSERLQGIFSMLFIRNSDSKRLCNSHQSLDLVRCTCTSVF